MLTKQNLSIINQKRMKTLKTMAKSLFVNAALVSIFLTTNACAMNPFKKQLPTTPYALPIDISKKGNKAEIDLRIKSDKERARLESKRIAFELKFFWHDPRNDKNSKYYESSFRKYFKEIGILKKYFRKYTKEEKDEIWKDYHRVEKLVGYYNGGSFDKNRKWIDDIVKGVATPNIRIIIADLDDENKKVVFDEILEVKKHWQIVGYFDKYLTHIALKPGNYKIIAEVQSDAPEFKGTDAKVVIGAYFLK